MADTLIGTIREFHTKNFSVVVDAIPDDDLDLSWDDDGDARRGIESGRYIAFTARARVFFKGSEVAADYLGGCIYKSLDAFMDHKECGRENRKLRAKGGNAICGSYFSDMVRNVCDEARKEIGNLKSIYVRA